MATNAEVAAALVALYPSYASIDTDRLIGLVGVSRALVPCLSSLPDTVTDDAPYSVQSLALVYQTALLAQQSPDLAALLSTSAVKRQKDGDVEIEYQATGAALMGTNGETGYAALLAQLLKPYRTRILPFVLSGPGRCAASATDC